MRSSPAEQLREHLVASLEPAPLLRLRLGVGTGNGSGDRSRERDEPDEGVAGR